MRIAEVHVGDLVTSAYYSPASAEPPTKLRVTAIERRQEHSWSARKTRMVLVQELDDNDAVIPFDLKDMDPSATGRCCVPAQLTPYEPVRARWEQIREAAARYQTFADGFRAAAARAGLVIPEGAVSHGSAGLSVHLPFEQVRLLTDLFNEVAG